MEAPSAKEIPSVHPAISTPQKNRWKRRQLRAPRRDFFRDAAIEGSHRTDLLIGKLSHNFTQKVRPDAHVAIGKHRTALCASAQAAPACLPCGLRQVLRARKQANALLRKFRDDSIDHRYGWI